MRAARIHRLGEDPVLEELDPPPPKADERLSVTMLAVPLNPVDAAIGSGSFYAGHPPLPYVPGVEGAGRLDDGTLVYVTGGGLGIVGDGLLRERLVVSAASTLPLPAAADPAVAAALGTAGLAGWLPIRWRAGLVPGDSVLVLGATGTAGRVAVQAARIGGAGRVVAAGRGPNRLAALGGIADVVVDIGAGDAAAALTAACPDGVDVIYDPLWGEPLAAALTVANRGARVVHVGASAGTTATLPSAAVRGKQLTIMGYSNFAVPDDVREDAYRELVARSIDGTVSIEVEMSSIADVATAWQRLLRGGPKQVVMFDQVAS